MNPARLFSVKGLPRKGSTRGRDPRLTLPEALLLLAALLFAHPASSADTRDADQHFFNLNTGDLRAEARDAAKTGKKAILFMFEQEGCPGCIYMKTKVLNRPEVQKFYRQHFLNFSVDVYGAVPIKDFTDKDHTEKSYAQALRVTGTPTFAFYDLGGKEIVRIVGPVKHPAEFLLLGEFVASGAYRAGSFADYKKAKGKAAGT
ncbi:MAG: thioredoxin family protein [Betaproteobacteria bacterium]